jgi:hypothetical protein
VGAYPWNARRSAQALSRATGITVDLEGGGTIGRARDISYHESAESNRPSSRTRGQIARDEIEFQDFRDSSDIRSAAWRRSHRHRTLNTRTGAAASIVASRSILCTVASARVAPTEP